MKYINIWDYKNKAFPFQFFIGGRGTGKTYSALTGAVSGEVKGKFLYMRRTQEELDLIVDGSSGEGANPFKPINAATGKNIGFSRILKKVPGAFERDSEKLDPIGDPLGYGVALSTVASIRSLDFSDVTDLIYDEFIPEKHVRRMRGESDAFLNAYESINRNREIDGRDPVYVWALANANDIYNPMFEGLGLVNICERMMNRGIHDRYIPERGIALHLLEASEEFTQAKQKTALYKMAQGTQFADMALANDFAYNDFSLIDHRPIKGYQPICQFGIAYIYRKKGSNELYVSYIPAKCPKYSADLPQDRRLFAIDYGAALVTAYNNSLITFESYELKTLLIDLLV